MAADPKNQKFGTMNSVFENVTIVEYRCPPLYDRKLKNKYKLRSISGHLPDLVRQICSLLIHFMNMLTLILHCHKLIF